MRVAVVGHVEWVQFINVEQLPAAGAVVHAKADFWRAAGGGAVAAAALAEHGAEVDFFCALGRDRVGEEALAQMRQRGMEVHVAWRQEPTRRAVCFLERSGERTIVTIGERLQPSGADALPWQALAGVSGLYFTAGDAAALEWASAAAKVILSPRAHGAFDGAGRVDAGSTARPRVDALVFSANDDYERQWAQRLRAHARLLVATEGARGGHFSEPDGQTGRWEPVGLSGPALDSYGCGDSFAAGFTFGLAGGATAAEAARIGAAWGARQLTRPGAP